MKNYLVLLMLTPTLLVVGSGAAMAEDKRCSYQPRYRCYGYQMTEEFEYGGSMPAMKMFDLTVLDGKCRKDALGLVHVWTQTRYWGNEFCTIADYDAGRCPKMKISKRQQGDPAPEQLIREIIPNAADPNYLEFSFVAPPWDSDEVPLSVLKINTANPSDATVSRFNDDQAFNPEKYSVQLFCEKSPKQDEQENRILSKAAEKKFCRHSDFAAFYSHGSSFCADEREAAAAAAKRSASVEDYAAPKSLTSIAENESANTVKAQSFQAGVTPVK